MQPKPTMTQPLSQPDLARDRPSPETNDAPPLATRDLCGGYSQKLVVRDVTLTLHAGEWLTFIGANGSGKSTLLRLCGRLLSATSGTVWLDGTAIDRLDSRAIAQTLAVQTQQQPSVPATMTVWQLVSMGRSPHQPWWQWELTAEDRSCVETALADTDLARFADRPVANLSGGERQRAFLALALAQNPKVLLLDEPTTFLDLRYQLELLDLLARLNRDRNLSVITVLHELDLAARYSHRLAMVRDGRIFEVGTPATVLTPDNLRDVFGIEATILETPVGLKVCPLRSVSASAGEEA